MTAADPKTKRVLILDGSIHTDIYKPADHWRALLGSVPSTAVHLPSGQKAILGDHTHVIITGSEASIVELATWYEEGAGIIREAAELGLPMLGSCFGHQLLVLALSGERYVRRSPVPEVGWIQVNRVSDDPFVAKLPSAFSVFASHFDEVVDLPEPWRILGENESCAAHIIRYGDDRIYGIQSHPEITPADGRLLLEGLVARIPDARELFEGALAAAVADDGTAMGFVEAFLEA